MIVAITLLALGIPVAGVLHFFVRPASRGMAPLPPDPGLTKALEDLSDKTLAPKGLTDGTARIVELEAADPDARGAALEPLVRSFGGTVLPIPGDGADRRLWVMVPERQVEDFLQALRTGEATERKAPQSAEETSILLEIVIKRKMP